VTAGAARIPKDRASASGDRRHAGSIGSMNHQIMKDIVHPVLFRERKTFMQNMQDGFDMYGKLIKELNLKLE
jgi:hypothetical protein